MNISEIHRSGRLWRRSTWCCTRSKVRWRSWIRTMRCAQSSIRRQQCVDSLMRKPSPPCMNSSKSRKTLVPWASSLKRCNFSLIASKNVFRSMTSKVYFVRSWLRKMKSPKWRRWISNSISATLRHLLKIRVQVASRLSLKFCPLSRPNSRSINSNPQHLPHLFPQSRTMRHCTNN